VSLQRDERDGLTTYGRLANELWARIASGEWKPGERLPTVMQMAKEYNIAPVTVRAALQVLSSQGLIHARQGRGTFVADGAKEQLEMGSQDTGGLDAHYFDSWIIGPSERVKVLEKRDHAVFPAQLADGAATYPDYVQLVRLHMSGDKPVCIVDFYVATDAYASLPDGIESQFKVGLLLMTRGQPRPIRGRQIVTIESAARRDAALLEIAPASPLVRVARRFLDAEGRVVGGGVHRYPGSVFRQVIDEPIDDILKGLQHWLPSENK
jgi:GntR family transcriptional regulator